MKENKNSKFFIFNKSSSFILKNEDKVIIIRLGYNAFIKKIKNILIFTRFNVNYVFQMIGLHIHIWDHTDAKISLITDNIYFCRFYYF